MRKPPLEKDFQKRFLARLRQIPLSWFFKINDRATTGILDILGGVNGYSFVIELKTRSKLTRLQLKNLQRAQAANCQSFVATPENAEEILAYVASFVHLPPPPVAGLRRPAPMPLWCIPGPRKRKGPLSHKQQPPT